VLRYDAVPDGNTKSTQALDQAIKACSEAGGGRVLFPAGTYLTGPVHLQSNVELYKGTAWNENDEEIKAVPPEPVDEGTPQFR
jgi:polygalacturonase